MLGDRQDSPAARISLCPDTGELVTMLVDGRNRLEACKRAGVKPSTVTLNGEDPTAYIISANLHRREMTKGQKAMDFAMLSPDGEKGGRGKLSRIRESLSKTEENNISKARAVLRHSGALARSDLLWCTPVKFEWGLNLCFQRSRWPLSVFIEMPSQFVEFRRRFGLLHALRMKF